MSMKPGDLEEHLARKIRKLQKVEEMYEIVRYFGESVAAEDRKDFQSRVYKSAFEIVDYVEGRDIPA